MSQTEHAAPTPAARAAATRSKNRAAEAAERGRRTYTVESNGEHVTCYPREGHTIRDVAKDLEENVIPELEASGEGSMDLVIWRSGKMRGYIRDDGSSLETRTFADDDD